MADPAARQQDYGPAHYASRAYVTKERFCSFWHQIDEVRESGARSVLEVGPGPGLVTDWIRECGIDVTTLDNDAELGPDLVGDATRLPLQDRSVDTVVCCQVLEHMPFEAAQRALGEFARVARTAVIVSLPDATPWTGVAYPLYFGEYIEDVRRRIPPSRRRLLAMLLGRRLRLRDVIFARVVPPHWALGGRVLEPKWVPIPHRPFRYPDPGPHHYEIGVEGYPLERILGAFEAAGLDLLRHYRVPENPWHHFFVARPAGAAA